MERCYYHFERRMLPLDKRAKLKHGEHSNSVKYSILPTSIHFVDVSLVINFNTANELAFLTRLKRACVCSFVVLP